MSGGRGDAQDGRTEELMEFRGADGGNDVVIAPEIEHFSGEGLKAGVATEDQAGFRGELAESSDGGFGASFDGLDGGEDGGVMACGKLGDGVEITGHGGDMGGGD